MRRLPIFIFLITALFSATAMGCMSMVSLTTDRAYRYDIEKQGCTGEASFGLIYGGIRGDASFMANSVQGNSHPHQMMPNSVIFTWALLDFPLSLVIDTVVLPATIPWSIYRSAHVNTLTKQVRAIPDVEREKRLNSGEDLCNKTNGAEMSAPGVPHAQ